jgi:hypothetical protein
MSIMKGGESLGLSKDESKGGRGHAALHREIREGRMTSENGTEVGMHTHVPDGKSLKEGQSVQELRQDGNTGRSGKLERKREERVDVSNGLECLDPDHAYSESERLKSERVESFNV